MDTDDDESKFYDPAATAPSCRQCGTTENITFTPDPFAKEIHDDDRPCWMCDRCRGDRADDI